MIGHNVTSYIAIGTDKGINSATLMSSDSGPFQELVMRDGITEEAERLGLFARVREGSVMLRKYLTGVYQVDFFMDKDGEFSDIKIYKIWSL